MILLRTQNLCWSFWNRFWYKQAKNRQKYTGTLPTFVIWINLIGLTVYCIVLTMFWNFFKRIIFKESLGCLEDFLLTAFSELADCDSFKTTEVFLIEVLDCICVVLCCNTLEECDLINKLFVKCGSTWFWKNSWILKMYQQRWLPDPLADCWPHEEIAQQKLSPLNTDSWGSMDEEISGNFAGTEENLG